MELNCIREALEKGNFSALNSLKINTDKKNPAYNVKLPTKLSEKELERRDYQRRLKEVEKLEEETRKLLGQRKRPSLLNPVQKRSQKKVTTPLNEKNISNSNNSHSTTNNRNNCQSNRKIQTREKIEIECDIDNKKDEEYLNQLSKEEKAFFIEYNQELFQFLSSVSLVRYFSDFMNLDNKIIEDEKSIIELSFLNQKQKNKIISKIREIKAKQNLELMELKEGEEFKKAVEEVRKTIQTKECGISVKNEKEITPNKEITCCWNCFNPIFPDDAIDIIDEECINKLKSFCSDKCLRSFEKNQSQCIVCKEPLLKTNKKQKIDLNNSNHFCSIECQEMFLNQYENHSEDNDNKESDEEKDQLKDQYDDNGDDNNEEEKEDYFYDPMEDL